ncbi:MAG: tRNA (adenosine(37)-N6)-dimethylallyltransferase MiaA [Leptospiraceae bacterium]|nr:tRNA (adenosine(37)-N6)-dimethylallyltransferase MiaA [Leptospiraceae bacterium]
MLAGATGSGKTELVEELGEEFEVISLDSRQIYRELEIGTAAPDAALRKKVPHHLVGIIDPDESFTAMDYRQAALRAIESVIRSNHIPILVGGAGFYLRMLRTGPFQSHTDPEKEALVRNMDHEQRLERLRTLDPDSLTQPGEHPARGRCHPNDAYRVERFLIAVWSSGKSMQELWEEKEHSEGPFEFQGVFLHPGEEILWKRLHSRVDQMIERGLLEEARHCAQKYGICPGLQTLGYKEVLECLNGNLSIEALKERLWIAHRQYARRQRIWFQKETLEHVEGLASGQLEALARNLFGASGIIH